MSADPLRSALYALEQEMRTDFDRWHEQSVRHPRQRVYSAEYLGRAEMCIQWADRIAAILAAHPAEPPDSARVEKLAETFTMEFLTGHYRELREDEQPRFDQLKVVMLAFMGAVRSRALEAPRDEPAD